MTETNYIGSVETTNFPIHRIQEAHDSWRQVYEGLQLIESHVEAGVRVPPDSNFGGMLGCEWQPRLAELPERLVVNLSTRVLPALEACYRHPDAKLEFRTTEHSGVLQVKARMTEAAQARSQVSNALTSRPQRWTQLSALRAGKGLLAGLLMTLDDILNIARA